MRKAPRAWRLPWRGQKLALYNGLPGWVLPILFIISDRFFDFYPFRQFAPVIHGKPPGQGRIAMGKNPHRTKGSSSYFS